MNHNGPPPTGKRKHRVDHRAFSFVQIRVPQVSVHRSDANLGHPAQIPIFCATSLDKTSERPVCPHVFSSNLHFLRLQSITTMSLISTTSGTEVLVGVGQWS